MSYWSSAQMIIAYSIKTSWCESAVARCQRWQANKYIYSHLWQEYFFKTGALIKVCITLYCSLCPSSCSTFIFNLITRIHFGKVKSWCFFSFNFHFFSRKDHVLVTKNHSCWWWPPNFLTEVSVLCCHDHGGKLCQSWNCSCWIGGLSRL